MTAKSETPQMRDKLIEILDADRKWPDAPDTADAIIAALPDMVQPLVWEAEDGNPTCEDAQGTGVFYRVLHRIDDMGLLRVNGSRNGETIHVTVDAAKAAANAHHRAQIMAALGLAPQGEQG